MSNAQWYAVWPDPRSRSRSRALEIAILVHVQNISPSFTMGAGKWQRILSDMSHLRFCRATSTRDSDARQSWLWRSVRQTNMASSDSDDDVIATSLFLLTSIVHEKHKLNERGQKRKTWERDWIAKRRQSGAYHGLVREIHDSDPAAYRNFLRMDDEISLHHSVQNILVTDQLERVHLCLNLLNFIMYIIISNNLWTKFWVPPITSLYYMFTLCGCVDTT